MAVIPKLEKQFIEKLVNEPVDQFTIQLGSAKGDNVAGDIFAIQVHTVSKKVLHLVYKILPSNNPMLRQYEIENRVFEMESNLYTVVQEKVQELVNAHGLPGAFVGSQVGLPIPRYYGGICDGEDSYLMLEDERPNGYRMSNKYVGYNLTEVTLILKELARYHAFTHFLIRYEGEKFFSSSQGLNEYAHGFWNQDSPENISKVQQMYGGAFSVALKLIEEKIGDQELAAKVKNKIRLENVATIARETTNLTDKEVFPVLLHGDFWTNNILLNYDPITGDPVATKFIDFQQIRRGNVYEDLLYFIFTSTTVDFRKQYLLHVLNIYYDAFVVSLTKLNNCPCPVKFSRGNFIDGFYKGYLPIYLYMMFAIPLQLGVPEDDDDHDQKHTEGTPANGVKEVDLKTEFSAMPNRFEKLYLSNSTAMQRLEELTREFVELGLF